MTEFTEQMNNLSMDDNRSGYVPPHRRNAKRGGMNNGMNTQNNGFSRGGGNNGQQFSRGGGRGGSYGGYNGGYNNGGSYNNGGGYGGGSGFGGGGFKRGGGMARGSRYQRPGVGRWVDGKHEPSAKVESLEKELFGTVDDSSFQSSGINFDNYDDIPVEATGTGVPEPITSFTSPPLDELLVENVHLARFNKPTPVQKYSVPICIGGRDLMACAQTGSGKTGGFLFPVLSEMYTNGPQEIPESNTPFSSMKVYPTALVLAPTRELVIQIFDEAKKFAYRSWVKPCVVYGGPPIQNQIRELEKGGDLLVATPGRLKDLLERGRVSLQNIRYLVLDEADRMLDMGFEPQIRHIVQECDMPDVQDRQTLMFSATFPKDIQLLARDFLKDYVFLSVGRVGSTSENILQKILYVEEEEKKSVLLDILATGDQGLSIIFTETKRMADTLADFLYDQNFPATAIHGDRSQYEREKALAQFKSGTAPILVATAVAARGLDIPNVSQVINFDLPSDIDDYVHRIGRTGRAGNTGNAIAFFNRNNKNIVKGLTDLLAEANQEVPEFLTKISRESNYSSKPGRGGSRGGSRGGPVRDFRRATGGGASNWGSSSSGGWGSSGGSSFNAAPSYGNSRGGSSYGGSSSYGNQGASNTWW